MHPIRACLCAMLTLRLLSYPFFIYILPFSLSLSLSLSLSPFTQFNFVLCRQSVRSRPFLQSSCHRVVIFPPPSAPFLFTMMMMMILMMMKKNARFLIMIAMSGTHTLSSSSWSLWPLFSSSLKEKKKIFKNKQNIFLGFFYSIFGVIFGLPTTNYDVTYL